MNAAAVLAALRKNQMALYVIVMLELPGWLFPPPALVRNIRSMDYIIIGSGTAGSVIATRLVQQKYNVLIVEAGPDAPFESTLPGLVQYLKNSHVDWNYTSDPDGYSYQCQVNKGLDLGIGKMLGGSSELNYMIYSRGNRQNFNEWARITKDSTWKWKNVLPYFIKSENVSDSAIRNSKRSNLFGTKGYIGVTRDREPVTGRILQGFRQIGKNIIADIDGNRVGYSRGLLTINGGFRQGAGSRYLRHVSESPYIAAAKNTLATKIIFDNNKKAVGVELITDEGETIVVNARKEIIISAGAIKSPQLLMLSGVGPQEVLNKFNIPIVNNLPVGKNLQDHVAAFIPHRTNKRLVEKRKDPGNYSTGVFIGYAALNKTRDHKKHPDYTVVGYMMDDMQYLLQFCASSYKFPVGMCNKLFEEAKNNQVILSLVANVFASSRGQVLLRSTDPMDSPKVLPASFNSDRDLNDFVNYINDYLEVEKSEAFKKLGATRIDLTKPKCDAFKEGSREYWRCYILCMMVSLRSYSGTCAMGSVVDSRLRVKGVSGLRVADASIMPTIVTGVTYNTVVMIAEKVSDMIIEDAGEEYNSMKHDKVRKDQIKNMPN